jgi:hypothetical protein
MKIEVNLGPFLFVFISLVFLLGLIFLISHVVFFIVVFIGFIGYLLIWNAPDKEGPE